jgi:hypothetical protein
LAAYFDDQARRFHALAAHLEAARQPANRR